MAWLEDARTETGSDAHNEMQATLTAGRPDNSAATMAVTILRISLINEYHMSLACRQRSTLQSNTGFGSLASVPRVHPHGTVPIERNHLVGLHRPTRHLHPGRSDRHTRHRQTDNAWPFSK